MALTNGLDELTPLWEAVRPRIEVPRRLHVLGVCQESRLLARRWGVDERKAAQAALLHDVTKGLSVQEQLKICKKYDIVTGILEEKESKLLHAMTGAETARHEFAMEEDVCAAIRWHTTGRAHMSRLETVLYLADYVETTRSFKGLRRLRALCYEDLRAGLLLGLTMSIHELTEKGRPVHPATVDARNALLLSR